jgi:hypothetical protein
MSYTINNAVITKISQIKKSIEDLDDTNKVHQICKEIVLNFIEKKPIKYKKGDIYKVNGLSFYWLMSNHLPHVYFGNFVKLDDNIISVKSISFAFNGIKSESKLLEPYHNNESHYTVENSTLILYQQHIPEGMFINKNNWKQCNMIKYYINDFKFRIQFIKKLNDGFHKHEAQVHGIINALHNSSVTNNSNDKYFYSMLYHIYREFYPESDSVVNKMDSVQDIIKIYSCYGTDNYVTPFLNKISSIHNSDFNLYKSEICKNVYRVLNKYRNKIANDVVQELSEMEYTLPSKIHNFSELQKLLKEMYFANDGYLDDTTYNFNSTYWSNLIGYSTTIGNKKLTNFADKYQTEIIKELILNLCFGNNNKQLPIFANKYQTEIMKL